MQLPHQTQVVSSLEQATHIQTAIFLCAICQRQVSAYDYFANRAEWGNTQKFESVLQDCWNWAIAGGVTKTPVVPSEVDFLDADVQSTSGTAIDAFSSLWHVSQWIRSKDTSNIAPPIENAFIILDSFLYGQAGFEINRENDRLNEQHELVTMEVERQRLQLDRVLDAKWNEDDRVAFRRDVGKQMLLSA